ncbi:MAG: LysR family transcriptional regulator [Planctomycetota bacterium]|jgi:DNA-binding transcriptional LysR family regulator|nr:LysR family transcriptional regulator [Planctomycetota bacterium]
MNIRQLSYIIGIAEAQSISRAAERLFISRPALNHYLIDLEAELGVPLFKRIGKKMVPTHAGTVYIDAAKKMLEIKKKAYRQIADASDGAEGSLSLGVTREIGIELLKDVFPIFNAKYPNFHLDLLEGSARELELAVEGGRIDLAVTGGNLARKDLQHIPFIKCEVIIALPPGHRLGHLASPPGTPFRILDLKLLAQDKFILISRDTNIRDLCDKHFAKAGILPHILMECSLFSLAYSMVRRGVGVSILLEHYVDAKDKVHCFSLRPREFWNQGVILRRGTKITRVEEYFIELAREFFARNSPFRIK